MGKGLMLIIIEKFPMKFTSLKSFFILFLDSFLISSNIIYNSMQKPIIPIKTIAQKDNNRKPEKFITTGYPLTINICRKQYIAALIPIPIIQSKQITIIRNNNPLRKHFKNSFI